MAATEINPIPDTILNRRIRNFCGFIDRPYFDFVRRLNAEIRKTGKSGEVLTEELIRAFCDEAYAVNGPVIVEEGGLFKVK